MITFLVIGRNEAATLHRALTAALKAVQAGDIVRYVDSGSTDDSLDIAQRAGVAAIMGSEGKGRALQHAFGTVTTDWVCTVDGDLQEDRSDVVVDLAHAVRRSDARTGMLVGEFSDSRRGLMATTNFVYRPLVGHLFPELASFADCVTPLSGFRAMRASALARVPKLPVGFGVEAHLNVEIAVAGWRIERVPVGELDSVFRYKPSMGAEIAEAIISSAARHDRVTDARSQRLQAWSEDVVRSIASYRYDDEDGRRRFLTEVMPAVSALPEIDGSSA